MKPLSYQKKRLAFWHSDPDPINIRSQGEKNTQNIQRIPFFILGCSWKVILHKEIKKYLAAKCPTSRVSEISCKSLDTHMRWFQIGLKVFLK